DAAVGCTGNRRAHLHHAAEPALAAAVKQPRLSAARESILDDDETIDIRSLTGPTSSGRVVVMTSALISCVLLFLNGGVVMAVVHALDDRGFRFASDDRITQFLVLIGPVLLLIIQWMMIDYLRARLPRRT